MQFSEDTHDDVTVFHLAGKIMGGPETQELRERLKSLIDSDVRRLVLDFGDVQWINSTGIGIIISCLVTLRNQGGDVCFATLRGTTRNYFDFMKLKEIVRAYESVDEAVADFSSGD